MKNFNLGTGVKSLGLALALLMSSVPFKAWAQDLGFEADEVLSYESLEIEGNAKKKPTMGDRIEQYRRQVEQRNEDLVKRKIEQQRIEQEKQLGNQLKGIFGGGGELDQVSSTQAAPVSVLAQPEKEEKPANTLPRGKVTPTLGITTVKSDAFDYEASMTGSVNAEALVQKHFGVGVNLNYTDMDIVDVSSGYYYTYFPQYPNFDREMKYKQYGADIFGKFYVTPYNVVSPYVGAGLGYSRSSLVYLSGNFPQAYSAYQNRMAEYNNSFFSGQLMGGADVRFSQRIGMNVEFKYRKSLTSNATNTKNGMNYADGSNGDQAFLNKLGQQIDDSHFASLVLGLIVYF